MKSKPKPFVVDTGMGNEVVFANHHSDAATILRDVIIERQEQDRFPLTVHVFAAVLPPGRGVVTFDPNAINRSFRLYPTEVLSAE